MCVSVCVCVSVADTCVDYTLYPVRQLTPVSLEYEEHVNVFVSGSVSDAVCVLPGGVLDTSGS